MPRPMSYPACQQFDWYESTNRPTITTPPSLPRRGGWTFSTYASWSARRERRYLIVTQKKRTLLNRLFFLLHSAVIPKNKSAYYFSSFRVKFWVFLSFFFFFFFFFFRHNVFWSYATALHFGIEVSGFKLHSRYYVHFRTNTLGKGMNPPYPSISMLNSITAVLLEGWLWH